MKLIIYLDLTGYCSKFYTTHQKIIQVFLKNICRLPVPLTSCCPEPVSFWGQCLSSEYDCVNVRERSETENSVCMNACELVNANIS